MPAALCWWAQKIIIIIIIIIIVDAYITLRCCEIDPAGW